ncbi:MAG: nicotinate-nucleotide adenylyltransferase, partial [Acidimicrobiia bacterium]|nr:nicotinate-nucleotide adenylyltransferase [Acidimicrobiia bacterium]
MTEPERLGIFGGTFDPLHIGHLVAARSVRHDLHLDRVLFVVANVPWQKVGERVITAVEHRYAMVEAVLEEIDGLDASDLEIRRGGESYTADTLRDLGHPRRELFLILGSDAAHGLPTWERADEVRELASIVVVERPGSAGLEPPHGWSWATVSCPLLDLSSSDLRQRMATGRPVEHLVPDAVLEYIDGHGLY